MAVNCHRIGVCCFLLCVLSLTACQRKQPLFKPLFQRLGVSRTGIGFSNTITVSEAQNPIDNALLYNGGGVAVGDFNRDGKPDLYFTGNQVKNALYLNEGGLHFKDVTSLSGADGGGHWCGGVAVVDINQDGWPDIYVCTSMKGHGEHNLLYVNQGVDEHKIPHFKEMAAEYGLADTGYCVQAAFFDYDNDGDLDLYLVRTALPGAGDRSFRPLHDDGTVSNTDRLLRNQWDPVLHHPVFTDVSRDAGILGEGFGLGVSVSDIDGDGWKDIYVTNDFNGNDELYINQRNGTFRNRVRQYFKHTSFNAMGNDIADLNNDGLPDVLALDMDPVDNYRKKMNMSGDNYNAVFGMLHFGYERQYVRNTLQLQQGRPVLGPDSFGEPLFAESGLYAGVAETDWSWSVLAADWNNDGLKDIAVTNGYPRDITDHDFGAFLARAGRDVFPPPSRKQLVEHIPAIRLNNYLFCNEGDARFSDRSAQWGFVAPSYSAGAAYADLDGDGDLDYVVSNIDDAAFVYENTSIEGIPDSTHHYLRARFDGGPHNRDGIGAVATIFYGRHMLQTAENSPYRGYLSTVEDVVHFGLGATVRVDSLRVAWPGGAVQVLRDVAADRVVVVRFSDAHSAVAGSAVAGAAVAGAVVAGSSGAGPLFLPVAGLFHEAPDTGIRMRDSLLSGDLSDLQRDHLLPHSFNQYGPSLAVADINGDGLDDLFVGSENGHAGHFLVQRKDGSFRRQELPSNSIVRPSRSIAAPVDMGALFFDADGDGHPDLYIASGGDRYPAGSPLYQDRFYLNDGKGGFRYDSAALPVDLTSKSCVRAADFDRDGDQDLFVAGRVAVGAYPTPVSCRILRNDSHKGAVRFTDVTLQVAPALLRVGMVTDAIVSDVNGDGWPDLLIVGEFMTPRLFLNQKGLLVEATAGSGLASQAGWWNSLVAGDFDGDGKIDFVAGNLGLNSFYRPSPERPVSLYYGDLDGNGTVDPILSAMLTSGFSADGSPMTMKEVPLASRDDLLRQVPGLQKRYPSYDAYAHTDIPDMFGAGRLPVLKATNFATCLFHNLGDGRFEVIPLPAAAQLSSIYGMVVDDVDGDGHADLVLNGNEYGLAPSLGPCDALNGLVLLGDGKCGFRSVPPERSGVYIPGDGKAMISYRSAAGEYRLVAAQHNGELLCFRLARKAARVLQ